MILEALIHGEQRYAETWPQMTELIAEVMTTLATEDPDSQWVDPGEVALLSFVDGRRTDPHRPPWPDNQLVVAVNAKTGYGGMTWCLTEGSTRPVDDQIADHVWVTDNPSPPDFDPRVVSDPGYPLFYHPNSTIPAAQIKAALEAFCQTGTGDRPESVAWVHGELSGRRLDAEPNAGIKRRLDKLPTALDPNYPDAKKDRF